MVPHIPLLKAVSYPEGYIRFRCPNLDCSIVYVEGSFDGIYVLKPDGSLTVHSSRQALM
jgi:hypothetical protein